MSAYTAITIIYNPKSTGSSRKLVKKFEAKLQAANPKLPVTHIPTEYAGHAEELAYELAKASDRPLIISASGDGGYHEVINGLIQAQLEGAHPVAGLLPAGNANDHHRTVHEGDMVDSIMHGKKRRIDLLLLNTIVDGQPFERYAHSYVGLGLTPKAGIELNKTSLNRLNEKWIVFKVLLSLKPVRLLVRGNIRSYDSLILANIGGMSKVLSISKVSAPDDGKFEVVAQYHRHKALLITSLLKAATRGMSEVNQSKKFVFTTLDPTLVQLDGEITTIDADTQATITLSRKLLRCIV